jgi:hypothetical protein
MRKFLVILTVCALALVVFTTAASAKSVDRPFKGSVSGIVWWAPVGDVLTTFSSAVGNASHMGRTMMTAHHPTPPLTAPNDYGPGEMILTAANGDEVWITYTGHLDFDPTAPAGTWFVGPGPITIVGGTGRFAGATGSAAMTLHLQYPGSLGLPDPWAAWWTWDGTIRY